MRGGRSPYCRGVTEKQALWNLCSILASFGCMVSNLEILSISSSNSLQNLREKIII
jgi:hypothetical protein